MYLRKIMAGKGCGEYVAPVQAKGKKVSKPFQINITADECRALAHFIWGIRVETLHGDLGDISMLTRLAEIVCPEGIGRIALKQNPRVFWDCLGDKPDYPSILRGDLTLELETAVVYKLRNALDVVRLDQSICMPAVVIRLRKDMVKYQVSMARELFT